MIAIQNMGNSQIYCLGNFSCHVPSTIGVFVFKLVYVLFWTWILNLMCKDGHANIAWLLVLLPFILLFVILGTVMIYQNDKHKKHKRMDDDIHMSNNLIEGLKLIKPPPPPKPLLPNKIKR
jgi:H+/Cl- antiporter ClcA